QSLQHLLHLWGYEVSVALDGDIALEAMDGFSPDCVISDIRMPNRSGYELAEAIRKSQSLRQIKLIALTSEGDTDRIRSAGFDHHVLKPVNPFVLEALLRGIHKMDARLERAEKLIEKQAEVVGEARDLIKEVKGDVKEMKQELKEVLQDVHEI